MTAPDFAGVLASHMAHRHGPTSETQCDVDCDWSFRGSLPESIAAHRAHVAERLNAELGRWLASEGAADTVARAWWASTGCPWDVPVYGVTDDEKEEARTHACNALAALTQPDSQAVES